MNKAFIVAKWEFLEKIKSKAFLFSLILMPIIIVGMAFFRDFWRPRKMTARFPWV